MMGMKQPQKELFSYQVDLDRRVQPDHSFPPTADLPVAERKIAEAIDFSFVRQEVDDCYG